MAPQRLSWLNLPVAEFEVLYDLLGDGILFVAGECAT
jgi:hypothetical protein